MKIFIGLIELFFKKQQVLSTIFFLNGYKIYVSEGIDINKSNKSKVCVICHYWYSKNTGFNFEPYVCNKCHDISMMAYELKKDIVILNVKGVDYKCILKNMTKNDATNRLNNSKLDDKGTL